MDSLTAGLYGILIALFLMYFFYPPFQNKKVRKQIKRPDVIYIQEAPQAIPYIHKPKAYNSWRTTGYAPTIPTPDIYFPSVETTTEGALPYWVAFGLPEDWKIANTKRWDNYKPFFYEALPGENVYYNINDLLENRKNKLLQ